MAFDDPIPIPAPGPVDVDVAICGGGFAGLTLARQLRIENPGVSVAVIDKLTRPCRRPASRSTKARWNCPPTTCLTKSGPGRAARP